MFSRCCIKLRNGAKIFLAVWSARTGGEHTCAEIYSSDMCNMLGWANCGGKGAPRFIKINTKPRSNPKSVARANKCCARARELDKHHSLAFFWLEIIYTCAVSGLRGLLLNRVGWFVCLTDYLDKIKRGFGIRKYNRRCDLLLLMGYIYIEFFCFKEKRVN